MPRKGYRRKIRRWKMLGGNTTWIRDDTLANIDRIYQYLESRTDLQDEKRPRFTYLQISKETGVGRQQVTFACNKMAYVDPPLVKITAVKYPKNGSARVSEKVELLMPLKEWLKCVGM